MKLYLRRISPLGIILIVIGAFLVGYPLYGSMKTDAAVKKFNAQWESARTELPDTENGVEAHTRSSVPSEGSKVDVATHEHAAAPAAVIMKTGGPPPIGRIVIPKISLAAPIAEGVGLDVLRYDVGHLKGSAALGGIGNTVLAGHRSYTYGEFFNRLGEVQIGDMIKVETTTNNFTYRVTKIKTVEPTDLSVLDDSAPKSTLTLITCTPMYSSRYRLIVTAERID